MLELEIVTGAYAVAIVLAIIGGITVALWPKPSLVVPLRITGVAFGALSALLAAPFSLFVHLRSPELSAWIWIGVGVVPSVGFWYVCACTTDWLTGGHLFGREEMVFVIEQDTPGRGVGTYLDISV